MPRLHHMADARPLDFYDCFALDKQRGADLLKGGGSIRLFGNSNIGIEQRTNTSVPGMLVSDQTAYIQNVYARTNFGAFFLGDNNEPLFRAMHEFASSTVVTLIVGDMPQRQWPLSTLLGRKHGDRNADDIPVGEAEEYFEGLAKAMHRAFWETHPDIKAGDLSSLWEQETALDRGQWLASARAAHRHLKAPQLVIVPTRQHHSVQITAESRSLGQLLEVLPDGIAPMPLVWVHLEGFSRRDVC